MTSHQQRKGDKSSSKVTRGFSHKCKSFISGWQLVKRSRTFFFSQQKKLCFFVSMMSSTSKQLFALVFASLLLSSAVADAMVSHLLATAMREMITNRSRRSILSSFFESQSNEVVPSTSRQLDGAELSKTSTILTVLMALPLALPLTIPLALPLIFLGGLYLLSRLVPQAIPAMMEVIGPIITPLLTATRQYAAPIFGFKASDIPDVETIGRTLQSTDLLERGFDYMNVREKECRQKTFCEVGQYLRERQPSVAGAIDLFGSMLARITGYTGPLRRGVRGHACDVHYSTCPYSPMRRMFPWAFDSLNSIKKNE